MSEWLMGLTVIFAEVGGVLLLLFLVVLFVALRRKSRNRETARHLAANVKATAPERTEKLQDIFTEICKLCPDDAGDHTRKLIRSETRIYQQLLRLITSPDPDTVPSLDKNIQALSSGYQRFIVEHMQNLQEREEALVAENSKLTRMLKHLHGRNQTLERENERLQNQLKEALENVDEVMQEYSRLYEAKFGEKADFRQMSAQLKQAE